MTTKLYKIMLLFLWLPVALNAGNNDGRTYDKTKTLKKEYSVNSNALVDLENKFGDVNIMTWNESRVVIEVNIVVSGNDEAKVEQRINGIDVNFQGSQSAVSAKTKIDKLSGWGRNNSIHYKINYLVKMPVTNTLEVTNDYGAIYINELKGKAIVNCDYGNVFIGDLQHRNNEINIDYCNGSSIRSMQGGEINADYSKFTLTQAETIKLVSDYSASVFERVNDLNYTSDYGSLRVGSSDIVVGTADYLPVKFGKINKRLQVKADYGSISVESVGDAFESVDIESEFCAIKLGVPNQAFNFSLNLEYSGFHYGGGQYKFNQKIEKSTSKFYEGYHKSSNNKAAIKITSSYGSVSFK